MKRLIMCRRMLLLIGRFAFGVAFIWASFGKIVDPDQFARQVARYQIVGPRGSAFVGVTLPWLEFVVGCFLLMGIWRTGAWLGSAILFALFTIARAAVIRRGMSTECGCGVMDGIITPRSLVISIALFATSIVAFFAEVFTKRRTGAPAGAKRINQASRASVPLMVVTALFSTQPGRVAGATTPDPQAKFGRLVDSRPNDPAIRAVKLRLAAMDQLAAAIVRDLHLRRSAFLDQTLATVGASGADEQSTNRPVGAAKIVERFRAAFEQPVSMQNLAAVDRECVQQAIQITGATLIAGVQSRAGGCLSVAGVDLAEIVRLAFVMPILLAEQNQNLSAEPARLPRWMKGPQQLRTLQTFAVESEFPRVAFALAKERSAATAPAQSVASAVPDLPSKYTEFASREADEMLGSEKYNAASFVLRDGIAAANSAGRNADAVKLWFRVAEILETTESAQAAADEMSGVRAICISAHDYCRASQLRLRYLFEAGQDQTVVNEAAVDAKDPRCTECLPQIFYLAWIASLRTDGAAAATSWRDQFLDRFPDHPLGAPMYFATAAEALADDNPSEGSRLLRFIEFRYPQCRLMQKVRQIDQRINAVVALARN